jgi:hypothetical protein
LGWRINNIRIGSIEGSKLVGNIKHVLDGLKEHDFVYAKNEDALKLKNRDKLLDQWITAFEAEFIEYTIPDKSKSKHQKYRLTQKGKAYKKKLG